MPGVRWSWRASRSRWTRWIRGPNWPIAALGSILAGAFVGLALLSKLSGTLSLVVIAGWSILAFAAIFLATGLLLTQFIRGQRQAVTP